MADQRDLDRAALLDAGESLGRGIKNVGAPIADALVLPLKAASATANLFNRGVNATLGTNLPLVRIGSLTQYSDETMFDRAARGGAAQTPTPKAAVPSIGGYTSDSEAAARMSKKGTSPAAASTTGSAVAQPAGIQYKDYTSTNPESQYDRDIEFTHTLSRMFGMAGLGDRAQASRDLYMKLNAARIQDVGTQAQRAFVAGDVTKGIDMFNHMIPNGEKIVGYAVKPDGSYSFKRQDGSTIDRTGQQLQMQLAEMTNPALIGTLMQQRAKTAAELQKDMAVAAVKHQFSLEEGLQKGMISHQSAVALELLKQQGEKPTVFQQVGGKTYVTTAGGKVFAEETQKGMDGKPRTVWTPAQLPGASGAPVGASTGRVLTAADFAAALGNQ